MSAEAAGAASSPPQRALSIEVRADTSAELEQAALDTARDFFGEGAQLELKRDYVASRSHSTTEPGACIARITVLAPAQ